jgi:serine/threonine-protein kinase
MAVTLVHAARRGATPEKLSRELRGDLDIIIAKALKKNPGERYESVAALTEDLRRYLKSQPIQARPDTFTYRAAKFARRNRTAAVLAVLVFVTTVAGAIGTYVQMRSARTQCNLAMQQLRRKQALAEFNTFLLSDAAPAGKPFTVNDLLDRAEKVLANHHADDDIDRVELLVSIGDQYSTQDDDAKARRVLEEAYRRSLRLPNGSTRAEAACALAGALARDGDLARAEALFQEGFRQLTTEADYDQERIFCLRRGSEVAQEAGNAREGVSRMEVAQQIMKASPFRSDSLELSVTTDLAEAYRMAGQNERASEKFEQASRLLALLGRENTQNAVVLYNDWGLALYRLGRPLEAANLLQHAISVGSSEKNGDGVSPMVTKNYAAVLRELGRVKEAQTHAERAYARARQVDNRVVIYQTEYLLALIYIDEGKTDRAVAMLADLEPRLKTTFPAGSFWFGALESAQAMVAANHGQYAQAAKLADQSIATTDEVIKNGGDGYDYLPVLLLRSASVHMKAGRPDDAAAAANRAISLIQSSIAPGAHSSYLGKAHLALARALAEQGKNDEAQAAYRLAGENLRETLGTDHPDTRIARELATMASPRHRTRRA